MAVPANVPSLAALQPHRKNGTVPLERGVSVREAFLREHDIHIFRPRILWSLPNELETHLHLKTNFLVLYPEAGKPIPREVGWMGNSAIGSIWVPPKFAGRTGICVIFPMDCLMVEDHVCNVEFEVRANTRGPDSVLAHPFELPFSDKSGLSNIDFMHELPRLSDNGNSSYVHRQRGAYFGPPGFVPEEPTRVFLNLMMEGTNQLP